ncbi:MAG: Ku protein [Alphaproteobacteria bacterium]|nr:Ku protein [Alphaproteobacteria bacterium]
MAAKASTKRSATSASKRRSTRTHRRTDTQGPAQGTRPLWSGTLRLALVSIPVKLFAATRSGARISFHQVHEPSGKRVRYQKVVPGLGPVDTDEIVKGFELEQGRYVLIDPEEIEDLKLEAKRTLNLAQFVEHGEIDPIWFARPYYVVPDGEPAEEAYGVLRDALRSSKRIGLGQFVMRGREYVAAIKPCGNGLLLETLRFADEVRTAAPFFSSVDDVEPDAELLDLAEELIERRSAAFDPERFEDQYTKALREMVDAKARRRRPVGVDEAELPSGGAKVIDLVDALKRSVRSAERPSTHKSSGNARNKAG